MSNPITILNPDLTTLKGVAKHLNRLAQALQLQAHVTPQQAAHEVRKVADGISINLQRTLRQPLAYSPLGYIPTVEQLGLLRDQLPRGVGTIAMTGAQRKFLWASLGQEPDLDQAELLAKSQGIVSMSYFENNGKSRLEWVWQGRVLV